MPHLLHIEDNPGDHELLATALADSGMGITCQRCENAVQAFEVLSRRGVFAQAPPTDLVVVDLQLPIINGLAVLNIITTHEPWRHIRVVVLSSSEQPRDREQALLHGAIAYIVKPRLYDDYLTVVKRLASWLPPLSTRTDRAQPR